MLERKRKRYQNRKGKRVRKELQEIVEKQMELEQMRKEVHLKATNLIDSLEGEDRGLMYEYLYAAHKGIEIDEVVQSHINDVLDREKN